VRTIAVLLLTLSPLAGCGEGDPRTADAEVLVRDYIAAVSGDEGDRGWSLLLPVTQRTTFGNDRDAYLRLAEEPDWELFGWEIGRVVRDEPYTYVVSLRLTSESHLPAVIAQLTDFDDSPYPPGPTFVVRFHDAFGGEGIWQMNGTDTPPDEE